MEKLQGLKLLRLLLFCLLMLTGELEVVAADVSARMDSVRQVLPSLKGKERRQAWTRLYYLAYSNGDESISMRVLDEWMADARDKGDKEGESIARQNKIVDFYNSAQYDSLKALVKVSMDFCRRDKDLYRKYFEAWHLLICSYHITGQYNTAIREVMRMHEEAVEKEDVFGQSMAYYNMGNVYFTMRHFNQSVEAFEKSVHLLQHQDSIESVLMEVYPFYGDALEATKRYQELEEMTHEWHRHVEHILQQGNKVDALPILANYYIGRTQALLGLGRIEEARKALQEAEKNIQGDDSFEWLYVLFYKAELAKIDGRYDEALALNTERIRLCSVIDDKPTLIPVHQQRAEILLAAGRYKEAAEMYRRTYELSDSLNTMQTRDQLNEMSTLFNVDDLKMQNERQRYHHYVIVTIIIILALLLYMVHRYLAGRRLWKKNEQLARTLEEARVANAKAEESSKMKTAFIRNVSHEIRTPLNIINGFTQVLFEQGTQMSDEEKHNITLRIDENCQRISGLVDKMLEMSDTVSHAIFERNDTVTLGEIVHEALEVSRLRELTAPMKAGDPVTFSYQPGVDEAMSLTTSRVYIIRALKQLFENARKFTKQGTIVVSTEQQGDMVAIIVQDTGIGIAAADAERIFKDFEQVNDQYEGTGIGLPMARGIARRLGGDIVLDTTYTEGARFIMKLPTM